MTHRRLRPRPHRLRYRVFSLLLDLDEIPELDRRLRLFSHRRFNLFGFDERDHADGAGAPLRHWVEHHLADADIDLDGGAIRLLAMPRVLGEGTVALANDRAIRARRYALSGDIALDDWYDEARSWVALDCIGRDGSTTAYRRAS